MSATRLVALWSTATDTRGTSGDFGKVHRADATRTLCGLEASEATVRKSYPNQRGTCRRCEAIVQKENQS